MANPLLTVRSNGQITLPSSLRQEAGIEEGDLLEAEVHDGAITLRPKVLVDKSQAYFWTQRWQLAERKADEDLKAKRVDTFDSMESLIQDLADRAGIATEEIEKDE